MTDVTMKLMRYLPFFLMLAAPLASAQMQMPPMEMHSHMHMDDTSNFLMRQASGTGMNPEAAPMHMTMIHSGDWLLMLHGLAFISQVEQSGPRGGDKLFS